LIHGNLTVSSKNEFAMAAYRENGCSVKQDEFPPEALSSGQRRKICAGAVETKPVHRWAACLPLLAIDLLFISGDLNDRVLDPRSAAMDPICPFCLKTIPPHPDADFTASYVF
jgi:hypothetical protein